MDDFFKMVPENMLEIGLGALSHANYHAAYYNEKNDKWGELSVLQAAHAAEILVKARIAQVHPLLIFNDLPSISNQQSLTIEKLSKEGKTIDWSDLPKIFKTITQCNFIKPDLFRDFGYTRNSLQHFGYFLNSDKISPSLKTLKFIYSFIDPFINEHWGLFAIDFDEDMDSYEQLPISLISYEITFLVSPVSAQHSEYWMDELENSSPEYQHIMKERIQNALKGSENNE